MLANIAHSKKFTGKMYDFKKKKSTTAIVFAPPKMTDDEYLEKLNDDKYLGQLVDTFDAKIDINVVPKNAEWMLKADYIEAALKRKQLSQTQKFAYRSIVYPLFDPDPSKRNDLLAWVVLIETALRNNRQIAFNAQDARTINTQLAINGNLTSPYIRFPNGQDVFNDDNGARLNPLDGKAFSEEMQKALLKQGKDKLGENFQNAKKGIGYVTYDGQSGETKLHHAQGQIPQNAYKLWENL